MRGDAPRHLVINSGGGRDVENPIASTSGQALGETAFATAYPTADEHQPGFRERHNETSRRSTRQRSATMIDLT